MPQNLPSHYRVGLPMMVLAFKNNQEAAITIQPGETFELLGTAQDDRFVVVEVRGEQFLIFESDLKGRSELVPGKKTPQVTGTDQTLRTA